LRGRRTIDARGKLVLPGVIDAHVHLETSTGKLETADDFASGTTAAAFGGVTTIIDFAMQDRGAPCWRRSSAAAPQLSGARRWTSACTAR